MDKIEDRSIALEAEIRGLRSTIAQIAETSRAEIGAETEKTKAALTKSLDEIKGSLHTISDDIEDIWRILNGDGHAEKGLRMDVIEIKRLYASVDAVVSKLQGDGSTANPGVFNELTNLVDITRRRSAQEKVVAYAIGIFGISLTSFFWTHLTTGISNNGNAIEAVKTSQVEQKVTLRSIFTDLEWIKQSLQKGEEDTERKPRR